MTKKTSKTSTSESAPHRQQFYLGVLAGAVIGAGIAYISSHRKGGTIKKDLLKKAKLFARHLPDIIDDLSEQIEEAPEQLKQEIKEIKAVVTSDPDQVGEEPASESEPEAPSLGAQFKATAQKAQRFFTKAGKMIKK